MFFWFLGTSAATVWLVFRDQRFDYRILFVGVLGVDVFDAILGGARVLHSVTASVAVLLVVVLVTQRGGAARQRWLALPIGMFLHLVFDGAFSSTLVFWWPAREVVYNLFSSEPVGWFAAFDGAQLPSVERGAFNVVLEVAGLLLVAWLWRVHGLSDPGVRRGFVRTGRLTGTGEVGRC